MNAILDQGHKALETTDVLTTKIGGENATKFQENLARAKKRRSQGKTQIIGVSALREGKFNTTDQLIEIAKQAKNGDFTKMVLLLSGIKNFHEQIIDKNVEPAAQGILKEVVETEFNHFAKLLSSLQEEGSIDRLQNLGIDWIFTDKSGVHHSLTGFGEIVCQKLYRAYFAHHGIESAALPSEEMTARIYINGPQLAAEKKVETQNLVREEFKLALTETFSKPGPIVQVDAGSQPYISQKRGYTDATVAEEARASDSLGIETLFNEEKSTPIRTGNGLPGAKVVPLMSRTILAELTGLRGAEAKVIHPNVASILRGTRVDMVVHNPDAPEIGTTFIPHEGGLELDDLEIVMGKKTKTVLTIEGDMENKRGVLATITRFLKTHNIDQTFSTRNSVTLTLDEALKDADLRELENLLSDDFGSSFMAKKNDELALAFILGGSQREHPHSSNERKIQMSNRIAQPPFAATLIEDGDEGIQIPYVFTVEGPMSDSPGVLAVITEVLKNNYCIEQTFSTETKWTITLDKKVSVEDRVRLHRALDKEFGNGWIFEGRTNLRMVTQTEGFQEHPLWTLLEKSGITVHYMHAIPNSGVTAMMIHQNDLSKAEALLHNSFHAA